MIKIAPSILSADFANLERDIRRVSSAATTSASLSASSARSVISPRFPIGVATSSSFPTSILNPVPMIYFPNLVRFAAVPAVHHQRREDFDPFAAILYR